MSEQDGGYSTTGPNDDRSRAARRRLREQMDRRTTDGGTCPCSAAADGYASTCTVHPAPRWYLDQWARARNDVPPPALEVYDELRVQGQPTGGFPAYDVAVRSDGDDPNGESRWTQLENVGRLARGLRERAAWADVRVTRRHVEIRRDVGAWEEVSDEELSGHEQAERPTTSGS